MPVLEPSLNRLSAAEGDNFMATGDRHRPKEGESVRVKAWRPQTLRGHQASGGVEARVSSKAWRPSIDSNAEDCRAQYREHNSHPRQD